MGTGSVGRLQRSTMARADEVRGRYSTAPARGRSDWLSILICGGHCGSPLSATGHASVSDFDGELSKDSTSAGRTAYVRAVASIPDAETKAAAWASATH